MAVQGTHASTQVPPATWQPGAQTPSALAPWQGAQSRLQQALGNAAADPSVDGLLDLQGAQQDLDVRSALQPTFVKTTVDDCKGLIEHFA
jgi:hypothetical protein